MSYSPTLFDLWKALRRVLLDVNAAVPCAEGIDVGELPPGPLRSMVLELLDSKEPVSEDIGELWVEGRKCELRFLRLASIELGIEFGTLVSLSDEQLEARLQTGKPECGGQVLEVLRKDYPAFVAEVVRHLPEQDAQRDESVTDDGESEYIFRRDGDGWFIRAFGEQGHFSQSAGFDRLARLVRAGGRPVAMTNLIAGRGVKKPTAAADAAAAELTPNNSTSAPLVDEEAIQKIGKKVKELNDAIKEAEHEGDVTLAEVYRKELGDLVGYLKAATQPSGKTRKFRTEIDRLRPAIHQSINRACQQLRNAGMTTTANHFEVSIRSEGDSFIYSPSPPIPWQ